MMKKVKKGFTLVELLVVIAIIAILAAIIAPNAFKAIEKSKVATAESDYKAIKTAALSYYSDTGEWPKDGYADKGFVSSSSSDAEGWNGPYLEKWPTKNPWGGSCTFNSGSIDNSTIMTSNSKYITLTDIPSSAVERLELDLDGDSNDKTEGVVRSNGDTVYLIISEQ